MRVRIIAVGTRMSGWVDEAYADYTQRLRGSQPVELIELATASRRDSGVPARARAAEGERILAALAPREHVVALDEQGKEFSTMELAQWLEQRRRSGLDLCFVIGGPDGIAEAVFERCQQRWSLSRLTLPHGLVRVLLAEQIYRATTVLAGHPYHRA
jgi:23S rRNA (pseudouridine1915-N3)-methyltransferase